MGPVLQHSRPVLCLSGMAVGIPIPLEVPGCFAKEPTSHVASDPAARLAELPDKLSQLCWDVADENPRKCSGFLDFVDGYHCVQICYAPCGLMFPWHKQSDLHMISQVCSEYSWLKRRAAFLSLKERSGRWSVADVMCMRMQWNPEKSPNMHSTK